MPLKSTTMEKSFDLFCLGGHSGSGTCRMVAGNTVMLWGDLLFESEFDFSQSHMHTEGSISWLLQQSFLHAATKYIEPRNMLNERPRPTRHYEVSSGWNLKRPKAEFEIPKLQSKIVSDVPLIIPARHANVCVLNSIAQHY